MDRRGPGDWVNNPSCLCDETSIKMSKWQVSESFPVGKHMEMLGGGHVEQTWKLCAHHPQHLALCTSSIWLFLSCILYDKSMIISKLFSWVLWAILAKSKRRSGGSWEPLTYSLVWRKCGSRGDPIFVTGVGNEPFTPGESDAFSRWCQNKLEWKDIQLVSGESENWLLVLENNPGWWILMSQSMKSSLIGLWILHDTKR